MTDPYLLDPQIESVIKMDMVLLTITYLRAWDVNKTHISEKTWLKG